MSDLVPFGADPSAQLRALQEALRDSKDLGDIIPETSRKVQDGEVLSSYDDELIEKVAYALVRAELVAEEQGRDGLSFKSTEAALAECGVSTEQFVQLAETDRFRRAHRRVSRLFFGELRYGRILKATSNAAMNGNVQAAKLVMTGEDDEADAVKMKLEEVEVGGEAVFAATLRELEERLRRLGERTEIRRATGEQLSTARATAARREESETRPAEVDHHALITGEVGE